MSKKPKKESLSSEREDEEYKSLTLRVPISLHRKMMIHRLETGESMNSLVVRIVADELHNIENNASL